MFVYELFKKLNAEDIVNEMIKDPEFFWEIDIDRTTSKLEKEETKKIIISKYVNAVKEMQQKSYTGSVDEIMILTKEFDGDDFYLCPCLLTRDKFDEAYEHLTTFDKMEDFNNPLYGICFETRDEVLSYTLSPVMLEKYSEVQIAATILDEVTFFGIEQNYCNERIEQNVKSLKEQVEEIDRAREEGREIGIPADEVFKELGYEDTRTEEEKEEAHRKIILDVQNRINDIKEIVTRTIELMR